MCCNMAAYMVGLVLLFGVFGALVPTWLGGSSWRGRFGDSGVSISTSSITARAAAAGEGSGARSMTLSAY